VLFGTVVVNWKFCAWQAAEVLAEQDPIWFGVGK
jgi:hypothetical protein